MKAIECTDYEFNTKNKTKMTLKERITADYMTAFKAKDTIAKNLLSVIKGEIQTIEKNTGVESMSDEDVLKIITKTKKSLDETHSKFPSDETVAELKILEVYLPKQMDETEIEFRIKQLIEEGATNIGDIMKSFAVLPADKKAVSSIYARLK
jgi:uncharacterized protein YqeY